MILNHFQSLLVFALCVSVVLACLTKRGTAGRMKSALWSFFLFIAVGIALAWLMYPFSR